MRIIMTETHAGFEKGQIYEISDGLAHKFINSNWAIDADIMQDPDRFIELLKVA